ncbi:MAG TPA: hypothetical protein VLY63_16985 [Anaerolineae bacterium]|nr:hypothetical protein [Anaerolineae bacterium]
MAPGLFATPTPTPTSIPTATATLTPTTTPKPTQTPASTATLIPGKECQIVSLTAEEGTEIPTFQIEAAGFLPNEGRMIEISGEISVGGKSQTFMTALAGLGGESADAAGLISQRAAFMHESQLEMLRQAAQIQFPTQEVTIPVIGKESGCEVSASVDWP